MMNTEFDPEFDQKETSDAARASRCRGSGRWIVEWWHDEEEMWKPTLWRGVSLARAMHEAKRLSSERNETYRCRDVDTDNVLLADIL